MGVRHRKSSEVFLRLQDGGIGVTNKQFVERMVPMSKHTGERLGPGMKRHPGETEWVLSHDVLREKEQQALGRSSGLRCS